MTDNSQATAIAPLGTACRPLVVLGDTAQSTIEPSAVAAQPSRPARELVGIEGSNFRGDPAGEHDSCAVLGSV